MRYGRGRHDRSVEALRHQIRRAGADTRLCRSFLVTLYGGGMLVAAALALIAGSGPSAILLAAIFAVVAGLLVVGIALPAARVYRRREQTRLTQSLQSVPDELCAEVAQGLRDDRNPDTRALAKSLLTSIRERSTSELAPADTPGGRGDEAGPAEPPR